MLRTILATVAAVEAIIVDTAGSVSTCSMPEFAFNECLWSTTLLHLVFARYVLAV